MSRYILACDAFPSTQQAHTRKVFERVFREYGLPLAILSDNGSPFGSPGLARLSRLSLWWIRLGISIERIVPVFPVCSVTYVPGGMVISSPSRFSPVK